MSLLHALGINEFAIVQFVIFLVVFYFLVSAVFRPYLAALSERQNRTVGGVHEAELYQHKAVELHSDYQDKVREVNSHIHEIFQKSRAEALAEYDKILQAARQSAASQIELNRQKIAQVVAQVGADLQRQTPSLALAITNKLLGR